MIISIFFLCEPALSSVQFVKDLCHLDKYCINYILAYVLDTQLFLWSGLFSLNPNAHPGFLKITNFVSAIAKWSHCWNDKKNYVLENG